MNPFRKRTLYLALTCMPLLLLGMAPSASASPVTLTITNANCGLSCGIVPANTVLGTVSMVLNGDGSVTVTVALNPGYTFIVPDGKDINFNGLGTAATDTISNFYWSTSGAPGTFTLPMTFSALQGNNNVNGFGTMAVTIFQMQDGAKPQQPLDYVQFTITSTTPFTSQDLQNVLFALHLGTCPQPNNGCNATTTGFVGTGTVNTVPEPGTGTLAIFGAGLLSVGIFLRRRFHSRNAV